MKTIEHTMLENIYLTATSISRGKPSQTVGPKNDYYITLQQLETILADVQS